MEHIRSRRALLHAQESVDDNSRIRRWDTEVCEHGWDAMYIRKHQDEDMKIRFRTELVTGG
jgi:hypothetical protein